MSDDSADMPQRISRRRLFGLAGGVGVSATLAGCSSPVRGPAVPLDRAGQASVLGIANERFMLVMGSQPLEAEFVGAVERSGRARLLTAGKPAPMMNLMAISGGGENGAFGAGLLNGWTKQGTRPVFDVVTGVSTGALSAPFAFLGSAYDAQLKAVYTELSPSQILEKRGMLNAALFDDALTDNAPLFKTITRFLTNEMLAEIGKGYDEGRLLLIGTTNLDAQVPVIWNIGAIARSGHPKAADTIRRILLASAAIPGAFPPTMFDVTLDGQPYQELHVDGGAFAQAFLYPASVTAQRRVRLAKRLPTLSLTAYVIRNGRLDPEWATVERRTMGIAGRAIATMIASSGYNDVVRIYNTALRDDVAFNLAYIGKDFTKELPEPFDTGYMRALYEYGYARAIKGYDWSKQPPAI